MLLFCFFFFFFNDTAPTEIYTYCHTLPLHDALPILKGAGHGAGHGVAPNGFTALNWVTGISVPQPWKPPTGLARAMAKRVSSPPLSRCQASSAASLSRVTALATRRPPGFKSEEHTSDSSH